MPKSDDKLKDFEKSLNQLEKIVSQMESGELGLEESLAQFEKGITLARSCQDTLAKAELRVEQLIEKNGLPQAIPFEDTDED
ncbi:MAG: exodeoxyribonuclease VII small subunit [Gammaproteobacteria bacterium]|nr:MAG: exodeoxyribonuclease VII small subunit [Gammaproteobacteria bacterium]